MNRNAMEDEVLGRCADDYEAPHTIAGDIARTLGRPISEAEVRAAFLSLASIGLVQSYAFDTSRGYVPISAAEASQQEAAWFMISAEGRKTYEVEAS